jgi:hypothetical protein
MTDEIQQEITEKTEMPVLSPFAPVNIRVSVFNP